MRPARQDRMRARGAGGWCSGGEWGGQLCPVGLPGDAELSKSGEATGPFPMLIHHWPLGGSEEPRFDNS